MKKQFTPHTSLVFFSYTRTLSTLISKVYPSLLLFIFTILFSQVSFSQTTITSASVNDDKSIPDYYFSAGHIETCMAPSNISSTGYFIAFVTDGDGSVYSSFTPEMKAGLTITDDNGNFAFFPFDAASYTGGNPTSFRNPDVVLLDNNKAIVTFETDDAMNDSYILELTISITNTPSYAIVISQGTGLNIPINSGTYASSPRIDGDWEMNRFAIVSIQGGEPKYSIYEPMLGGSYQIYNSVQDNPSKSFSVQQTAMFPDIALGHLAVGGDAECVVSYIDGDPGGTQTAFLMMDYQDYLFTTPTNHLFEMLAPGASPGSTTLFTATDPYPNYPHICSEEEFGTSGNMQWAIAESLIDPAIASGSGLFPNHMLYVHSDFYYQSNSNALFYVDASNTGTNTYQQGLGTLDWMYGDAFVAWRHEIASPNTQQIVGVMNPFLSGVNPWEQVYYNYNIASLSPPSDRIQAISVSSDKTLDMYVVAELFIGKIIYKVRYKGNTGFKPNNIAEVNNAIYPNPCNDILNITAMDDEQISIKDVIGNNVYSTKMKKGLNTINTSLLSTGNYFLIRGNNNSNSLFTVSH